MLTPTEVYRELLERGCALRPGASSIEIEYFQRAVGSEISAYVRDIYILFDGFVENTPDDLSQINIWSISGMVEFAKTISRDRNIIAFGDVFLQADFLCSDFTKDDCPVFLLEGQDEIASSYETFWYKFLNSEFDIPSV